MIRAIQTRFAKAVNWADHQDVIKSGHATQAGIAWPVKKN